MSHTSKNHISFKNLFLIPTAVAAALSLSACAATLEETIKAGGTKLSSPELSAAFAGKTLQGYAKGFTFDVTFRPNGTFDGTAHTHNHPVSGTWAVKAGDEICIGWDPSLVQYGAVDYCYYAARVAADIDLFDTTLLQERLTFTPI